MVLIWAACPTSSTQNWELVPRDVISLAAVWRRVSIVLTRMCRTFGMTLGAACLLLILLIVGRVG
jgi:hypothetical protein